MYIVISLLSICITYTNAISYEALVREEWENFKIEHGKIYKSEAEEQYRQSVYMENLHKINENNKLYEMGLISYKMAINQFGDLPEEEFLKLYADGRPKLPQLQNASAISPLLAESMQDFIIYAPFSNMNISDLPGDIDWRDRGAVTQVKDQGRCGSCWSFSATGSLEGQWYKKTNRLVSLSEQNLMDCSRKYGNEGCNGGWTDRALRYVKDNGGIDTEQSYPYRGRDGKCHYRSQNRAATVSRVVLVPNSEQQLQIKVGTVGPMSIAIAVGRNFHFYHSGVYDNPKCGRSTTHAVLAVGYGTLKGKDYWLVKNSWGKSWGDKGYVLMSRNKNNQCGIATDISYPIV